MLQAIIWINAGVLYWGIHGPITRYTKLRVVHAPGMPGTFSRHRLQRKPLVSDPGMHHGTGVTYVPWRMWGSLTRGGGENVPGIPCACATRNFTCLARGPCISVARPKIFKCSNQCTGVHNVLRINMHMLTPFRYTDKICVYHILGRGYKLQWLVSNDVTNNYLYFASLNNFMRTTIIRQDI